MGIDGSHLRNRSEHWFRRMLSNISDTVSLTDADGKLLFTTGAPNAMMGYPESFWTDLHPMTLVHPDDFQRAYDASQRALELPHQEISEEVRMRAADGSWQHILVTGVNLLDDPDIAGMVLTTRNVTALRRAERLTASQAAVLELIARGESLSAITRACVDLMLDNGLSGSPSIYILDGGRLELRAGDAPEELRQIARQPDRSEANLLCDVAMAERGATWVSDLGDASVPDGLRQLAREIGVGAAWSQPILATHSGEPLGSLSILYPEPHEPSVHEQLAADAACSMMAIALDRIESEDRLAHQALHDPLTTLPNRTLLLDRLDHALARRASSGAPIAMLFCDIDRFKVINDSLGHNIGDQLLVAFSRRLRSVVAPGDTVARFGGDEFVVLIEDVLDDEHPTRLAQQLSEVLTQPFLLPSGNEVFLTVSIGLAPASDHVTGDAWLRDADAAMYRAKEQGRDRLVVFDAEMRDAAVERLQVENDLRRASSRGEWIVHYQPFIDLKSGRIAGAEALVRWNHPESGLLWPKDFIEVAEDIGAIVDLGRDVLDTAVREMASLGVLETHPAFQLGVNVSARQVNSGGFDVLVRSILEAHGWPSHALALEITESALVESLRGPIQQLESLHELGVSLAIDDFGTGYSSLARLGHLPVSQVKIDRQFVAAIDDPENRLVRIVDAVIAIAGALDQRTTAEGVESQAQLDYLRRQRCEYAQGYLISKPLAFDEFSALIDADPRW